MNSLILTIPIACIFLVGKYADDGNAAVFILILYCWPIIIIPVITVIYNLFKLLKYLKLENPNNNIITVVRDLLELALYSFGIKIILLFVGSFEKDDTKIGKLLWFLSYNFYIFVLALIFLGAVYSYLKVRKKVKN